MIKMNHLIILCILMHLYGHAMVQYPPTSGFKWLTQNKIKKFDVSTICEDNPEDCILEVHFEYPEKLHNLHNDYALTPEKIEIKKSCYQTITEKLLMSATFQLV